MEDGTGTQLLHRARRRPAELGYERHIWIIREDNACGNQAQSVFGFSIIDGFKRSAGKRPTNNSPLTIINSFVRSHTCNPSHGIRG